jgi:hypothetical protein
MLNVVQNENYLSDLKQQIPIVPVKLQLSNSTDFTNETNQLPDGNNKLNNDIIIDTIFKNE